MYLVSKIRSLSHPTKQSNLHYASQKLDLHQYLRQSVEMITCYQKGRTHFGWILHLLLTKQGIDYKVTIISNNGACYEHVDS